ncbi:hypothetical protein [Fimbriiglobus ruber]|uniref:hypothetical protein n=1 Tax=Fimbriiglobus ruber TaxID=1908690 RepID=UPI000B4B6836|nr:hypothetical protein [Fimbriiglobus ruber]
MSWRTAGEYRPRSRPRRLDWGKKRSPAATAIPLRFVPLGVPGPGRDSPGFGVRGRAHLPAGGTRLVGRRDRLCGLSGEGFGDDLLGQHAPDLDRQFF